MDPNDSDSGRTKRDPALLNTLFKLLPPSSKVKDYLKYSIPNRDVSQRPISAGGALTGTKQLEKFEKVTIFFVRNAQKDL